jgi:repressor LexA
MPASRTSKQTEVFEFIMQHVRENGYAPSIREICTALGLRSTSTVHYHLTALAKRGLIQWEGGKNRAIRVLVENEEPRNPGLPIKGRIAAGRPIEAISEGNEYLNFEEKFNEPELYVLKVRGESMIDEHLQDGDFVVVNGRNTADNGEMVIAMIEGTSATVKRLYREPGGWIRLQPANEKMRPIRAQERDVMIQGVVVGVIRKY